MKQSLWLPDKWLDERMFGGTPMRKRWKRKSGYITPQLIISKKELIENDLFLDNYYNDWDDWRDRMRDWYSDFKLIKKVHRRKGFMFDDEWVEKRTRMNQKQKKLLKSRKLN